MPKKKTKRKATVKRKKTAPTVKRPNKGTRAALYWSIIDGLKKKLKRRPARFEFLDEICYLNTLAKHKKKPLSLPSAALEYHWWRHFHKIKPGASKRPTKDQQRKPLTKKKAAPKKKAKAKRK